MDDAVEQLPQRSTAHEIGFTVTLAPHDADKSALYVQYAAPAVARPHGPAQLDRRKCGSGGDRPARNMSGQRSKSPVKSVATRGQRGCQAKFDIIDWDGLNCRPLDHQCGQVVRAVPIDQSRGKPLAVGKGHDDSFGRVVEQVRTREHQACLLVTIHERPAARAAIAPKDTAMGGMGNWGLGA